MTIQHSAIIDPNIHEPKGAAAASSGMAYVANGAGSGSWRFFPHSYCFYANIGTGTTYTGPTAYTLIAPATTADSAPQNFTHNSLNRLTYTGSQTIDVTAVINISFKHSSATLVDSFFQLYKNGVAVAGAEFVVGALSGTYTHLSLQGHVSLATNGYLEVFCKTASGNIIVHAINFSALGHI